MPIDKEIAQFAHASSFADWLAQNHADHAGIRMKIAKRGSETATVSYDDAVGVALQFGWIDGPKASLDADFYLQTFTPRRPKSIWSKRNVDRVTAMIMEGTMNPAGLAEVDAAKADGRWDRAYEGQRGSKASPEFLKALNKNPAAKAFYKTLNAANRYALYYRIQSAVKPETRERRIEAFVEMLARGETFH
ncbi:MAG: hypothetical protein QOH69_183 [Actinomycetota bacterium]|jgi:uncharacterized protein YdeI (YjbR/CyaY-like superfamily)|nr:hypothetical protein [Actinomycetota bacterium]